jgi:hypothetical protein
MTILVATVQDLHSQRFNNCFEGDVVVPSNTQAQLSTNFLKRRGFTSAHKTCQSPNLLDVQAVDHNM